MSGVNKGFIIRSVHTYKRIFDYQGLGLDSIDVGRCQGHSAVHRRQCEHAYAWLVNVFLCLQMLCMYAV